MTLMELLQEKRIEIIKIAAQHGAFNIRVFGSVARGEETENSDIDFLIDYDLEKTTPWFPGGLLMDFIVLSILNKMSEGTLNEAGSQLYQFLEQNLQGIFKLDRAKEDPELLEAVILNAAKEDQSLKNDLEKYVLNYQKEEQNQVIQNNQYGANVNQAYNSTFIAQQNIDQNRSFRN